MGSRATECFRLWSLDKEGIAPSYSSNETRWFILLVPSINHCDDPFFGLTLEVPGSASTWVASTFVGSRDHASSLSIIEFTITDRHGYLASDT